MINLMKSYFYQLKRGKMLYIVLALCCLLPFITIMTEMSDGGEYHAAAFVADNSFYLYSVGLMYAVMMTGFIVGGDLQDRTVNYELMSGHTRFEVYASKTILSLLVGVVGYLIIITVPVVFVSVISGFGDEVLISEVIKRNLLSIFPLIRILCECIFLTFILRIPYVTMAIGFFIMTMGEVLLMVCKDMKSILLGITSIYRLSDYLSWSTYTLRDTVNMINIYDAHISMTEGLLMVAASLLFAVFFLIIGYRFFKTDDMR